MRQARGFTLIELVIVVTLIALIAAVAIPCLLRSQMTARQAHACTMMKTLVNVEAVWRSQDADRNGNGDYWVRDVRGMHSVKDRNGAPVNLINIAFAWADRNPAFAYGTSADRTRPNRGYYVQAMTTDQDGAAYVDGTLPLPAAAPATGACTNRCRFGFTAFPDVYGNAGIVVFVVGEDGLIRQKDLGAAAPALDRSVVDADGGWLMAGN
jgi:prepilin-type N-terminal cleavage/methylation domain-containing protein